MTILYIVPRSYLWRSSWEREDWKHLRCNVKESLMLIKKAGLQVESDQQTLADIGRLNHVPPQKIYLAMKPAAGSPSMDTGRQQKLPDEPPPGTGNLTLADLCNQYDFNTKIVLEGLRSLKIEAREDMDDQENSRGKPYQPFGCL